MMRKNSNKRVYVCPKIKVSTIFFESSIAAGSAGEINFNGNEDLSTPMIQEWSDNTENLNDYTKEQWF